MDEESLFATRHSPLAAAAIEAARAWIGTPYVHQASVKGAGCDCLGLLRGVWRELRGAEPEDTPPYSPDWAEATGSEALYLALRRHLTEISPYAAGGVRPKAGRGALFNCIQPGDVALFRMTPRGPAKHCGIVACVPPPFTGEVARSDGGGGHRHAPSASRVKNALGTSPVNGGGKLTLIHARQNKRVSEEAFSALWRGKLAFAFRL